MDRAIVDRELRARFAVATEADDVAIRRLLRENPMRGAISVSFEREPSYFRGAGIAGGEDQTIAAFADERLVCMGRCTLRECWVNGRAARVGYLAELRLDECARGRFGILRDGYEFFHEQARYNPADVYFTSISADNDRARRLLERGARGLPQYVFLSELETLLVTVPRRPRSAKIRVDTASLDQIPDLVRLLNSPRRQLATVWTAERLKALVEHGLPSSRFLVAVDKVEIIACGAVWDQREFRQTVIRGYSRAIAVARPVVNLLSHLGGPPHLPAINSVLAHAFLSPLAFAKGREAALPDFIEATFPLAAQLGLEFLTLGLPATDPRLPALRRRFSTRAWRSRLYRVAWPEHTPVEFSGSGFLPDIALL